MFTRSFSAVPTTASAPRHACNQQPESHHEFPDLDRHDHCKGRPGFDACPGRQLQPCGRISARLHHPAGGGASLGVGLPPVSSPRFTTLTAQPRWWEAFPVVDPQQWIGWSFFVGFKDVFFMSLMFFLWGLFVQHSMGRKGVGGFLRDRLLRLGLPFVVAAAVIAPLAYYPTYLLMPAPGGSGAPSATGPPDRRGSSGCCWRLISWLPRCSPSRRRSWLG
jgi:hypothetical protein